MSLSPTSGAAVALMVATLAIAGCGGGSDSPAPPAPTPPVEQPPPPPAPSLTTQESCSPFTTANGTAVQGNISSAVTNPAGGALTFTLGQQASRGVVALSSAGAFTYTPSDTGRGFADTFTYTVRNAAGASATGTAKVVYGAARIMPMGDSITQGVETYDGDSTGGPPEAQRVAYRYRLFQLLTENGYAFDFVGRITDGAGATPPLTDTHHEGYGGILTSELAAGSTRYTTYVGPAVAFTAGQPDIVLLHAGTNDANELESLTATPMKNLLTAASTWATANQPLNMVVAKIIKFRAGTAKEGNVATLNNAVTAMINQDFASTTGRLKVSQADFQSANIAMTVVANDPSGLHPSRAGYDAMAQVWYDALVAQNLINRCD